MTAISRAEARVEAGTLRTSFSHLQAIRHPLRWVPDFFFVLSEQGVYLDYGISMGSTLLVPPERFLGAHVSEVFQRDTAARLLDAMDRARRSTGPVDLTHAVDLGGVTRYYAARFRFRRNRTFMCFVFDLAAQAQKRAESGQDVLPVATVAHAARVSLVARLAASLVHELGQPLGAMLANANAGQRLCRAGTLDRVAIGEVFADVVRSGEYATAITDHFRAFLRNEPPRAEVLDLNVIVKEVELLTRAELAVRRVKLDLQLSSRRLRVFADRTQLQQVVLNLVLNAADAVHCRSRGAGRVSIRTASAKGHVSDLLVDDNGPGFSAAQLAGFFRPFVSTRPKGMGLGLALCEEIVRGHGGSLTALNPSCGGARVRVVLPRVQKQRSSLDLIRAERDAVIARGMSWQPIPADLPSESRIAARQVRAELLFQHLRSATTLLDCVRWARDPAQVEIESLRRELLRCLALLE